LATYKPNRGATMLRTLLALLLLFLAACGGTPPTANQPTQSDAQSQQNTPPASEATSAPEATTASEATSATETSAADSQAQTIGEQLDLGQLSPDIAEPAEPVTITFATWSAEEEGLQKLVEQFQQLHPNITIDLQGAPSEEMQDKLLTQVAGGTAPDVAYMDTSWVIDFASRNALVNLDEYISKSNAVDPDDYVDAFRDSSSYEGSMYGLPVDGETTGLFYRTDLFEAAGIAGPPKTWEEFEEAARKLTDAEKKQYGFALFATEAAYYWYPWLWQAGGRLLSEDGSQIAFNDEAGKRAAEFYVGLKEYAPEDFLNSNSYDGRVAFANGTVGMYVAGAWFAGTLRNEFPDIDGLWAAAPLPQDQQCATTIAGDAVVIFEQSQNKEAAWKWIEFLSAPQVMASQTIGTPDDPGSLLPPRKSLIEDPRAYENNELLRGFAEQMDCGVTNSAPNENYGQVEQILNEQLARAIFGEVDAATALDEAAREGQELLAP
jgi:multiple sugar transport system substrate-binding protein